MVGGKERELVGSVDEDKPCVCSGVSTIPNVNITGAGFVTGTL